MSMNILCINFVCLCANELCVQVYIDIAIIWVCAIQFGVYVFCSMCKLKLFYTQFSVVVHINLHYTDYIVLYCILYYI